MTKIFRSAAVALALAALPSCSTFAPRIETPFAAARTIDQQAYALIGAYAAALETAAAIAADPATPHAVKAALAKAEAVATPLVETVEAATLSYLKARADIAALAEQPEAARDVGVLAIAATRLSQAIEAARAPVAALQAALN
jgi:hypothetical protein